MIGTVITFLSMTIAVVWSLVFLPASLIGVRISKVGGFQMKSFLKQVSHASIWTNDEAEGWICGKWFIGYVQVTASDRGEQRHLWTISTRQYYDTKIKGSDDTAQYGVSTFERPAAITYWVRQGPFWDLQYSSRPLACSKKHAQSTQALAVSLLLDVYEARQHAVALLHGGAGGGKSMTAQFLCTQLLHRKKTVHFCDTHMPYENCDSFDVFYQKIGPTADGPLVVVFEEVDGMIVNLHRQAVKQKHFPIQMKNKTDWNSFLDKFDRDIYPYVILLLTTNKSAQFFDDLDPSYMRVGRVDLKLQF
jgi:hypothetical protein